jgi:hypothetical protein
MISRPAVPICLAIEAGIMPKSLELAQYAARPLMVAIVLALAIASAMGETYPKIFPMRLSWYETTGRNQINQEADNCLNGWISPVTGAADGEKVPRRSGFDLRR